MNILYIGDVMAEPGQRVVKELLTEIKDEYEVDFVIAQAENIDSKGKGPGKKEIAEMQKAGIDFFTGGNHSLRGDNSEELFDEPGAPVVRPANMKGLKGSGWKIVDTLKGKILVVSMLGQTVGRQFEIENPLTKIDEILEETRNEKLVARIINLHGDFSSEKVVYGYYLDGRMSAVIGDHWHVPTSDAMVLPNGTAHITDVGMCGILHSSLGVKTQVIIDRWKSGKPSQNELEEEGELQFNAVLVNVDTETGLANSIEQIRQTVLTGK